ncbi:TraB/GumN family protein [Erythrobacter sp. GH1-10]|uniref:TraB/GumN family protein n=1 Tax=Erythrobacter sp. GH1-10 TaxID=3349334 RepID=UPI0038784414
MKPTRLLVATASAVALHSASPTLAQDEAVAHPAESEAAAEAGAPALWLVADEDTNIYLFGTVHKLPGNIDWNSGPVEQALNSSDELVTEIDMTPESLGQISVAMREKGMLPEGQTLRGLMTEEQRATFEAGIGKLGLPANAFDKLEPWLAALTILQITLSASGFEEDSGVEKVLEATVPDDTKRVALEAIDFQISIFDELPVEQQILFLLEGAENPVESIGMLNQLVDVWASGKVDELGSMMNEALLAHPNLAERMLYSRNANWAAWIDERLDRPGVVFLAAGAGHFAGEKSVQDYLAERGIETKRVQ